MANIVPYINFANNGQEAIKFYKGVFGGDAEVQFEGERVLYLDGIHFEVCHGDQVDSTIILVALGVDAGRKQRCSCHARVCRRE